MTGETVVMNFSHVYEENHFMRSPEFKWIDCTALDGTNCYLDGEAEGQLTQLIAPYGSEGLHWIDSGDYHYMSKLWTDKVREPFTLVVFDHHPDMQPPLFDGLLSCGSWLRAALDSNPRISKAWVIGMSTNLLGECDGFGDRLSIVTEDDVLSGGIPDLHLTGRVYLSIDKDVFSSSEVLTNWDQGSLTFSQFAAFVSTLDAADIIGMDICGEDASVSVSSTRMDDKLKNELFNERLYKLAKKRM